MHVAALFRYPVKGFTRESCESLEVLPGGRIAGDRVLGLRLHDSATPDAAWSPKYEFAVLVNTPALARLRLKFDHVTLRLRIELADQVLFDGTLDDAGRKRFAATIEQYLRGEQESPIAGAPDRLPLRVVGDAVTPRYQDREPGYVTLHGRGSLAAIADAAAEAPEFTERRFRSNVAVDGLDPWEEQRWIGRNLRVGDVEFKAVNPVTRCLATHANPDSGKRDVPIMKLLPELFPSARPTFAIMMVAERGGVIRVGDRVEPIARSAVA
jgi:uncharacterized protein YcbX